MKKWESKVCTERFDSEEKMQGFLTVMGQLGWESVSVFPSCFPKRKIKTWEQEAQSLNGPKLTFTFKRELAETIEKQPE